MLLAMTLPIVASSDRQRIVPDDPARGLTADADRLDVTRALAGDREAFADLVRRHQARIIAHLVRMVGRDEAADLAQDAFVRAWTALDRYDPTYPFRGWLLVIASRLALHHRARRREPPDLGDWDPPAPGHDPAQLLADADETEHLRRRLEAALARLGDDDRMLYELRYRQDLPISALAAELGCSTGALKVRLLRMRRRLGGLLGVDLDISGGEP
jgi:RNA polymerase sigma-70 factor, ECF subfamily